MKSKKKNKKEVITPSDCHLHEYHLYFKHLSAGEGVGGRGPSAPLGTPLPYLLHARFRQRNESVIFALVFFDPGNHCTL